MKLVRAVWGMTR